MRKLVSAIRRNPWSGPAVLTGVITILHFSFDPHLMFWHDLLRRAYYVPILWAVYVYGFRGGSAAATGISLIFAVHLLRGWGNNLGGQWDQIYDIVGYLFAGFVVGLIIDRARNAAFALAQQEAEVSLRGVINAAVHEMNSPKREIDSLAQELMGQSRLGTWEHSVGLRIEKASKQLAAVRQDMIGIAKIVSGHSTVTRPFDWAMHFANDEHLGARFGMIMATIDKDQPPPALWPIAPSVLDEVTRCLLEDVPTGPRTTGIAELSVGARNNNLVIEFWRAFDKRPQVPALTRQKPCAHRNSNRVRRKLLDLAWSRFNGGVQRFETDDRCGFRLTLHCPKLRGRIG